MNISKNLSRNIVRHVMRRLVLILVEGEMCLTWVGPDFQEWYNVLTINRKTQ